jgi:hydroxymethylpyrimidine pyrophosphatase-like HAD family hydrolase
MKIGVNKGFAIKKIQKLKNITYDETMVFGDMMNDYEMMQAGYYSYAMGNAVPEIKQVSRFITDTNDGLGVLKALQKHFNVKF